MIAIKRKKSSGKMKTKFTLMKISAAVVFIQVANTSDALIGKFLQVKKWKNKQVFVEVILEAIERKEYPEYIGHFLLEFFY